MQGLTLVLDRHSHKVSAATVAEDFKGRMLFGLSFEEVLQAKAGKWSKAYIIIMLYIICIQIRKGKRKDVDCRINISRYKDGCEFSPRVSLDPRECDSHQATFQRPPNRDLFSCQYKFIHRLSGLEMRILLHSSQL